MRQISLFFLIFLLIIPIIFALNCYQGQTALNTQPGSAAACSMSPTVACTKSVDYVNQIVVRGCQTSNCTFLNGTVNSAGGCFNSSTNSQSYCCCYADSCNGAKGEKEFEFLITGFLAVFAAFLII
ncbi:hypothetical protein ACQ4LE_007913 [Meloidogyne hapla]|uniref:Activin_recp domain-containing protein n=1 Tax=Meloidogyne hapla TaxID=6305 RepID=A0A1I8BTP4_MELHA